MNATQLVVALVFGCMVQPIYAREISLADTLSLAEKVSPDIQSGRARESQAKSDITIATSYLYPSLNLSAVDSWGLPGSGSPTPPDIGGILDSPYRNGFGIGVLARVSVFDLRPWLGRNVARAQSNSVQEQTKVVRLNTYLSTLQAFVDAARYLGQEHVWANIAKRVNSVEDTLKKRVKVGQYNDVARLLIQDQQDQAHIMQASFHERYLQAKKRVALFIDLDENEISVASALTFPKEVHHIHISVAKSPFLARAEFDVHAAKAQARQTLSEHFPRLYATASGGYLVNTRLVDPQYYSIWLGVTVPLFEGFRLVANDRRAGQVQQEKRSTVQATELALNESYARYDESINAARVELAMLDNERKASEQAIELAQDRFLNFLGSVIDLREALRDLTRIDGQIVDRKADLFLASSSKAILQGAVADDFKP